MLPTLRNLLTSLPAARDAEVSETLITARGIRLQGIISFGQVSPEGFWYDQTEAEWVMLLTGRARLLIAGEADERILGPGDLVYLPAHCRHRVEWTDPDHPTVWLALFIDGQLGPIVSGPMNEGHALGRN
jgi:cupin 2 domain-containing protein